MKTYRAKCGVEAMRWTDTDKNREAFAAWFEKHDAVFETRGPVVVLPVERLLGGGNDTASEGDWILYVDDEFNAMSDARFHATYEEIA
jgi:hypothetical protein